MTTPERPIEPPVAGAGPGGAGAGPGVSGAPAAASRGWDDERLTSAFAVRASRAAGPPGDLVTKTLEQLRPEVRRHTIWGRLLPAGAALVLLIAAVGGGLAMLGGPGGPLGGGSGLVDFRDGPTPDLRTLDAGTFALDFPTEWIAYDAGAPFSGGSSTAVLTTQPIEARCGDESHVDINCVFEQRLEPGQLRIFVGTGAYRGNTILDRADIENGTSTRLTLGGMPAILDEFDVTPDDYYLADQSAGWAIATPTSLGRVIRIEFRARDPEAVAARTAVDALVASFRFAPPPTPLPDDPEAAVAAARTALDAEAAGFRQGFVPADDAAQTYLDCLGARPDVVERLDVSYGPGGALGWRVTVDCRWAVAADTGPFWRIDTTWDWSKNGGSGTYTETTWIDATSAILGSTFAGEPLPAGAAEPTPTPAPSGGEGGWPPNLAQVVDIGEPDSPGYTRVAVVDRTGTMIAVRPATDAEVGLFTSDIAPGTIGLANLALGGILAIWGGSMCDDLLVLDLTAAVAGSPPSRIEVRGERASSCRLGMVSRALWLDFSAYVDASTITGLDLVADAFPAPTPAPWPPDGATVIELQSPVGAGRPPARVAVVDLSGLLASVREVRDGDPAVLDTLGSGDPALLRDLSAERRYRLRWTGSICDGALTVTIQPGVERIVVDEGERDSCDLVGIGRELVLDFSADIDLAATELELVHARLIPESVAPDVPTELFGLDVIDVEAALVIQARPNDDREIAVRGWLWRDPAVYDCDPVTGPAAIANGPPGGIVLGMSGGGVRFELDQTELPASK